MDKFIVLRFWIFLAQNYNWLTINWQSKTNYKTFIWDEKLLENKKVDNHKSLRKTFHLYAKLIVNDSNIDRAFGSMHQSEK